MLVTGFKSVIVRNLVKYKCYSPGGGGGGGGGGALHNITILCSQARVK